MVRISNSATLLTIEDRGAIVICGSHGGLYSAYLAARAGVRGIALSDAGCGLDDAGIAGLGLLERVRIGAIAIGHNTARIGDGRDMARRGRVSVVNAIAADAGCRIGMSCGEALECLATAPFDAQEPAQHVEMRVTVREHPIAVTIMDSISLVQRRDIGAMVVSGSHGGLIGAVRTAVKIDVLAAVYHDAGGGIDDAGFGRLPALDELGIIGATVDGMSARIGDGMSVWETGRLSRCNQRALAAGVRNGMSVREMADLLGGLDADMKRDR